MSFRDVFAITSPGGPYTDATGSQQTAAPNTPRFDHTPDGSARGLLVQGLPEVRYADVVTLDAGYVGNQGCTVLHQYEQPNGEVVRRAVWSTTPTSTINALLNTKGWHQDLVVVGGALTVANGAVTYNGASYRIVGSLAVDPAGTNLLGVGDAAGSTLIGVA